MACKHWHEAGLLARLYYRPPEVAVRWFPGKKDPEYSRLVREIEDWLRSDAAKGYHLCDTAWPENARRDGYGNVYARCSELGWVWLFTSTETAEAFRKRFGL